MLKPDQVTGVACGRHHTLVSMKSGMCWSFGSNSEGQLGAGRGPEWSHTPVPWEGVAGGVAKLVAGAAHSLALSHEGAVWGWGSNTEGQLGLGEHGEETVHTPTRLPLSIKVSSALRTILFVIMEFFNKETTTRYIIVSSDG